MRKLWGLVVVATLVACGEDPEDPSERPCTGADCSPCLDEVDVVAVCQAAGAECGEVEATDRCGVTHEVDCGGCGDGKVCEAHQCVVPMEGDACRLVPATGVCRDAFTLERCEGAGEEAKVATETCAEGEICVDTEEGARCRALEACEVGQAYCTSAGNLRTCVQGSFEETVCEYGCLPLTDGAACRPQPPPGTVFYEGDIRYQHRVPNESMTGWAEPEIRPAAGLFVMSLQGDAILDTAVVAEDGTYRILVPENPAPADRVVFMAFERLMGGTTVISVVDPDLPAGGHDPGSVGPESSYWAWAIGDLGDEIVVLTEQAGSRAIQVFQAMRQTVRHVAAHKGLDLPDFTGWFGSGVDWTCGACFIDGGSVSGGHIFISGGSYDAATDSVLFHESGHYAFAAMGPPHTEGGTHCLGVPAPPGQALSEGHATWYAADRMKEPRVFREQQGMFFYYDLDRMRPAQVFTPPVASAGPLQNTNESWVSAVLWRLSKEVGTSRPVHAALSAQEMQAPFASGYTGKVWWEVDQMCRPVNPLDTQEPTPVLTDLLDAMLCGGYPEEPIRTYVMPYLGYDPSEPSCK